MSPQLPERGKAAGGQPATQNINLHTGYSTQAGTSSKEWLGRAADVLLLMQYPLTVPERTGFGLLLQRRLERAYGGVGR